MSEESKCNILLIEPFYGGSHKQLIDLLKSELCKYNIKFDLYSLPSKKWHWRARTSALYFSSVIKRDHEYKILFASSVLNLCELVALRNDLNRTVKIIYFHENQLVYPIRNKSNEERDFQYGYNQILTSLVADKILFNSNYNKTSFLNSINTHLKLIPDNRPKINTKNELEFKCNVFYYPIDVDFDQLNMRIVSGVMDDLLNYDNYHVYTKRPIHILWSNRWEHDKNPELFFDTLFKLNDLNLDFRLSVLGEQFSEIPDIFKLAKEKLNEKIINWGYLESKDDYFKILSKCDIVVSTSIHEFFGVAVLEACIYGAYPLVPNRLVYPEIYPKECLYSTDAQLLKKLKYACSKPHIFRKTTHLIMEKNFFLKKFLWSSLKENFMSLFN